VFHSSLHAWVVAAFPMRVSAASNLMMEICVVLCICLGPSVRRRWNAWWMWVSAVQVMLVVVGMVRSAWVSLAVVLAFLAVYRPRGAESILGGAVHRFSVQHRLGAAALGCLLAAPLALGVWGDRVQSIRDEWNSMFVQTTRNQISFQNAQWRLAMWASAFEQFAANPLMGMPFGQIFVPHRVREAGYHYSLAEDNEIHMSPLSIGLRMGLPGAISFMCIVAVSLLSLHQWICGCADAHLRRLGVGLLACQIMVLAHSLSCVMLEGPYVGMLFWLLLAMGVVLQCRYPTHGSPGRRASAPAPGSPWAPSGGPR